MNDCRCHKEECNTCKINIESFKCVRYDGNDLDCIGVTSGDTLHTVIQKLNKSCENMKLISQGEKGDTGEQGPRGPRGCRGASTGTTPIYVPGPQGEPGIQGDPGLSELILQNTLVVAKNGNDTTGTRNDWTKPYLTVAGASADSQPGDVILVLPGLYFENTSFVPNVRYHLFDGVTVYGNGVSLINTTITGGSYFVTGDGILSNSSGPLISMHNGSQLTLRAKSLSSGGAIIDIDNALIIRINTDNIGAENGAVADIRGYFDTVSINARLIQLSNTNISTKLIKAVNVSDVLKRNHLKIVADRLLDTASSGREAIISIDNSSPELDITLDINRMDFEGTSDNSFPIIDTQSGRLIVKNSKITSYKTLLTATSVGAVKFKNCEIFTGKEFAFLNEDSEVHIVNSEINTSMNSTNSIVLGDSSTMYLHNSIINNNGTGEAIAIISTLATFRQYSSKVVVRFDSTASISATLLTDVYYETNLTTNKPTVNLNNLITGTSELVNTGITYNNIFEA